jgi:hypothetical protein
MVLAIRKKKRYKSGVWPLKVIYNNGRKKDNKKLFHITDLPPTPKPILLAYQVRKETQLMHKLEV